MVVERGVSTDPSVGELLEGLEGRAKLSFRDLSVVDEIFDNTLGGKRGHLRSAVTLQQWLEQTAERDSGAAMVARKYGHLPASGPSDVDYAFPAA